MTERVRRRKSRWDEEKVACIVNEESREEDVPSTKNDVLQTECMSPKWSDIDMEISPTKDDEKPDFSCWQTSSENKGDMELEKVETNYNGILTSKKSFGEYRKYNISPDRSVRQRRDNSCSPEGGWYRYRRSNSRGRSRNRSKSRTPPGSLMGESEEWNDRARNGSRVPVPPFNDFAKRNCTKDNQWSYPRGPGGQDGGFPEEFNIGMNSRSANTCYDFLDGNCIRGSLCKYSHHSAPVDHREERETTFKRIDVNDSYDDSYQGALLNHHEARETTYKRINVNGFAEDYNHDQYGVHSNLFPCKYFASGFCRNGDACKFTHEVVKDDNMQQPKYPEYMVTMDRGFDGKIVNKLNNESRVTWEVPRNSQGGPILKEREVEGDVSEFTPWLSDEDIANKGSLKLPSQGNSSSNTIVGYNYQNTLPPNPSGQKLYPSNSEYSTTSGSNYQNSQPQNRNGGNSFPSNPQPGITNLESNPPNSQPQNMSGKNIYPPNSGSSKNPNMFNHYGPQTQNSGSQSIRPPNSELANTSMRFSHHISQPQNNPSGHNIYPLKSESSISANMGFDNQISQPQNLSSHPPISDSFTIMKTGIDHQALVPQIPNGRNMYLPNSQSASTTGTGFNHKNSLTRNPTSSNIYSPTSDSTSPVKLGLNHQKSLVQTPSGQNKYPPTNLQSANTTSTGFNRQISQPLNPTVSSFQPPSYDSSTPINMGLKHQVSQPQIPSAQMVYRLPQSESVSTTSEGLIRQSLQPSSLSAHSNHPSNSESSTTLNIGFSSQNSQLQFPSGQNMYPSNTSTSTTNAGPNGQISQLQNSTGSSIHPPNSGSSTPIHMGFNLQPSQSQISSGQNMYVPNTESSNITSPGFNWQSSLPQNPVGSVGHPPNSGPASTTNMGFGHQISHPQYPSDRNIYPLNSKSTNTKSMGLNHLISQPPNPTGNSVVCPISSSANTFATMVPTAVQNLNPSGQIVYSPTVSSTNTNQQSLQNFSLNERNQKNSGLSSQKLDEIIQKMPMPPMVNGAPTTRNVITSEQVAQITNLSGLIPQLYAAALSSVNASILLPNISKSGGVPVPSLFGQPNQVVSSQSQQNPIINSMAVATSPFQNSMSVVNIPVLPSNGQVGRGHISTTESLDNSQLEQVTNPDGKVFDPAREQEIFNGDAEMDVNGHIDAGNSEKDKDMKGMRLFKAALVDFIKEALKPIWKEGQMGRETHKTIVKRVVEKVTSTTKEAQIPQTQHKIDQYLASCKPRLTKLVQAYVEKYNKT